MDVLLNPFSRCVFWNESQIYLGLETLVLLLRNGIVAVVKVLGVNVDIVFDEQLMLNFIFHQVMGICWSRPGVATFRES